jgi:hypothetical protein
LEAKKKENFQLVADACMEEYTKTYGEMPENDSWMFLEAEYYGTGEGQTLCLQMTQANPRGGDNGDFDRDTTISRQLQTNHIKTISCCERVS